MDLLTVSQIFFNFTVSFSVIFLTVLLCGLIYEIMNCIGAIRRFFSGLHQKSEEVYDNVHQLFQKITSTVESISFMPFLGKFFKKRSSKKESKETA